MSEFLLHAHELMTSIDALTTKIHTQIEKNELDKVVELITQRLDLLAKIVAFASTSDDKKSLTAYLIELQKKDQVVMDRIAKDHEDVKTALMNIKNVKQYVNV